MEANMDDFERGVSESYEPLRRFAISLYRNIDRADDLVQETLAKALANRNKFREGSNLSAWLFTILRNHYYSEYRKRKREVEDPDGVYAAKLASAPNQLDHLEYEELRDMMSDLPQDQKEALVLVAASGFSCEEAADTLGVAVGTVKSRVSRARKKLLSERDTELIHVRKPRRKVYATPRRLIAPSSNEVMRPTQPSLDKPGLVLAGQRFVLSETFAVVQPDLRQSSVQVFKLA